MLFDISFCVFHFYLFYADELILFRSIREDVRGIYRGFSLRGNVDAEFTNENTGNTLCDIWLRTFKKIS